MTPQQFVMGMSKNQRVAVLAGILLPAMVLKAWTVSWLWWWFLTPLIHTNPPHLAHILGLIFIVGYTFRGDRYEYDPRDEWEKMKARLGSAFFSPFFSLAVGWIFKSFM